MLIGCHIFHVLGIFCYYKFNYHHRDGHIWHIVIAFIICYCQISRCCYIFLIYLFYPIVFWSQISSYNFFSILQTKDHAMYLIYHGCMTKNKDCLNRLIGPGEKCLVPTDECFWKDPRDIRSCMVKTRSCTRTEPTVSIKDYHTISLYTSETMDQSMGAWYRTKEQLIVLLLFLVFIILFIINNGNILTDRTNEMNILKESTMIYNFLLMKYIFYF